MGSHGRVYSDQRVAFLDLPDLPAGTVVDVRYARRNMDATLFAQRHYFGSGIPVLHSIFHAEFPSDWTLEHKFMTGWDEVASPPVVQQTEGMTRWTWERRDVSPIEEEPRAPGYEDRVEKVAVRLAGWIQDGQSKRANSTFEDYGRFLAELQAGTAEPTPQIRATAKKVLANVEDEPRAQAAALYEWVQENIRYVAIEVGLGGWRPYSAKEVFDNRYGDCKDKATLLKAMLEVAGIESYMASLYSHRGVPRPYVFPNLGINSNHAILAIQLGEDLIIADPTERTVPFGQLPPRDQEVDLVVIDDEKPRLVKTYGSRPEENQRHAILKLSKDGDAWVGESTVEVTGAYFSWMKQRLLSAGGEDVGRTIKADGTVIEVEPTDIKVDESEDDDGIEVHTLFMPKVDVGSVLEWRYTRRYPFAWSAHEEFLNDGDVPVRRTKFTLRGDKGVRYTVRPYNLPEGKELSLETKGGQWVISAKLENLQPIDDDEWYRPTRERIDPWIAYSTRQIVKGTDVWDWSRTWDEALDWRGAELYWKSGDWYAGAKMDVDVSDCADARCKIEKDLAWLRSELPTRGTGGLPGRKAKTSIEVGSATSFEKTRIMHKLLDEQGIESLFALGRRHHDGPVDEEVPTWLGFRYMLLRVPAQDGISEPMWLDPGCEYCQAGEVHRRRMAPEGPHRVGADRGGTEAHPHPQSPAGPPRARRPSSAQGDLAPLSGGEERLPPPRPPGLTLTSWGLAPEPLNDFVRRVAQQPGDSVETFVAVRRCPYEPDPSSSSYGHCRGIPTMKQGAHAPHPDYVAGAPWRSIRRRRFPASETGAPDTTLGLPGGQNDLIRFSSITPSWIRSVTWQPAPSSWKRPGPSEPLPPGSASWSPPIRRCGIGPSRDAWPDSTLART